MNNLSVILVLPLTAWIATAGLAQAPARNGSITTDEYLAAAEQMQSAQRNMPMPDGAKLAMDVPSDTNAWVIRVASSGGFTGQSRGFALNSLGNVRCTEETPCRGMLSIPELQSLGSLLTQSTLAKWLQGNTSSVPPSYVCNDCVRVWLELRHREPDGSEKVYSINWDETSKSALPTEIKKIYETAVSFRRLPGN